MTIFRDLIDVARQQVNRLSGLDVVRVSGQYTLKAHIAKVLDQYGVRAVIDVGANEGAFGALMRSLGFQGRIYSFEPVAEAFDVLQRRASKDGDWQAFNYALGAEDGTAQINVSKFSQFSSIREATSYGNSWENMRVDHTEDIAIRTIDGLFRSGTLGEEANYFLKMDTQGYDLEVFKGAQESLKHVSCMLSELSLIPLYEGMPNYIQSLETFNRAGFLVSGLYPITRHACLALNEVDCMMVKPKATVAEGIIGSVGH